MLAQPQLRKLQACMCKRAGKHIGVVEVVRADIGLLVQREVPVVGVLGDMQQPALVLQGRIALLSKPAQPSGRAQARHDAPPRARCAAAA